ncbi:MAG: copper resistance protein CopC, partial [Chloroflexi bacterium]|nr:copper resistance protein CopC [Chloroflexota bacterium]
MRILPNVPSLRTISIGAGLLALLLSATALALSPGKVSAHGVHVASEPPPNAVLEDSPDRIEITFSEPIEPAVSTILLFDQQGQEVTLGAFESFDDPQTMAVAVPDELESAIYTVIWRNLSTVDGHTWSGSFPFSILGPGGVAPTGEVAASLEQLAAPPSD